MGTKAYLTLTLRCAAVIAYETRWYRQRGFEVEQRWRIDSRGKEYCTVKVYKVGWRCDRPKTDHEKVIGVHENVI